MRNRILASALLLLALTGCADTGEDFPREIFSNAYTAAIDQGFVEAVALSSAALGIQNRGESDLASRIQSNLAGANCTSVDTPNADTATLIFDGICPLAGREWTGSIEFTAVSESEFDVVYNGTVKDRRISGDLSVTISNVEGSSSPRGSVTIEGLDIDGIVANYDSDFEFAFGTTRADDGAEIDGYRLNGSATWNNLTGNLWSSTMSQTLVRPDSNIPRSGSRLFDVDGNVNFRMLVNALTADSTEVVLRAGDDNLRICVDENGADDCPSL